MKIKEEQIERLVRYIFEKESCAFDIISVIYTDDKYIKKLNKKYLNHNYSTDILTFNYSTDQNSLEAEMYISFDTVRKNADYYKEDYKTEMFRVLIHGCLHLAGYNDRTKSEILAMRKKENYHLKNYVLRQNN